MKTKTADASPARVSQASIHASSSPSTRKAWKKKTPVEVVLDQLNKARENVAVKEEAYKEAKKQAEKLEAARKILEAT